MSHAHTLIRTAAVAALTGLATTGARVYPNRMHPMADANLPGLRVFLNDESVEPLTATAPLVQRRSLQMIVECCAMDGATLDASCDQMQLEVEKALAAGLSVSGHLVEVILTGSGYDFEAAAVPVGVKRVMFTLDYFTPAATPDSLT